MERVNLILFGFKGCGKTHFGQRLATLLHRQFIDTDNLISEIYAKSHGERLSSKEIYQRVGGEAFRILEKEAILWLSNVQNAIIALGGGAVLDPDNVLFLQELGTLVYLEVSPHTLRQRLLGDALPAFFDAKDPDGSFRKMIQERKPIYESIPAHLIRVDELDEAGVLASLRSILNSEPHEPIRKL